MATQGGIADELLVNLAEEIETGEQMEALGRALGFKAAAINRYTDTNIKGDRVTCKGTRDMLFAWRQKVEPNNHHSKLKQALEEANLIMLSQNYLKDTSNVPDTASRKISESLNVHQCRMKLEKNYFNKLCKIQMKPWDSSDYAELKDMHTRVTMVKKDAHGRDTVKKEILHGSVTEIFSRKVNNRLPDRILISAAAGRGKTTAVAKMAHDWCHRVQGSGLEDLPLLFVLRLRNAGKSTSLGEAIKSQLLSGVDDVTPEKLENFIRMNQDICHIIFDGLDEYAGITSRSSIVKIMRWEEYLDCRVLVTTRPHLENFFNKGDLPRTYTKMGIEGFSRESSRNYIDKFFALIRDVSTGESLKVYLDGQPLINELVITPLFCLMVCHLWSEGLLIDDISTQTELLDSVNVFLMHHANARNSRIKITTKRLKTIISELGKVALAGLLSDANKLVFTPLDFGYFSTILDSACDLGIIFKTTVSSTRLPQSHDTAHTTIEFYHKLAQEHSAAKHLAAVIDGYWLPWMRWNMSKLDRVLRQIKAHIGDYENLIRFTAGTGTASCIKILEAILTNESLDESERYRILLDCSSETTPGTEGNVSSLVQRCVTSQMIVLKSPTVYTVVGMQNLPEELKRQVGLVNFEESSITFDVTNGLWSCLGSFPKVHTLTVSDSSLSFPSSPPELPSVTKLEAKRVTSQSYEGLLSSLPGLEEIDITIDDGDRDISQITAGLQRTGGEQLTCISLRAPQSLPSEKKEVSRETMRGLGLLIREQTKNLHWINVSGLQCRDDEDVVDLVDSYMNRNVLFWWGTNKEDSRQESHLTGLYTSSGQFKVQISQDSHLVIKKCQLSAEMAGRLWSYFRSFTTLRHLTISDSSLSLPPSPPELPYVTKLEAKRVTSQSYEGLLSSLPGLEEIDITIADAERDISQITAGLQRIGREQLTHISLQSLPSQGERSGGGSVNYYNSATQSPLLEIRDCLLSAEITDKLWSYFRSFTTLHYLIISDSSLSFPSSPPELPYVTMLEAWRVTSQSYEGLLSSLPGLKEIDITIDNAESDIDQITACLQRTGREQLTCIRLQALPSQGKGMGCGSLTYCKSVTQGHLLEINDCFLSAEITDKLWSYFRSFTTLRHLTILDSSLSFPSSPPELPYVTKLEAEGVTSQSYEGLLSSLPGLKWIDITIDNAESYIDQITAGLQRTGREQLIYISLRAPLSLPSEKRKVSRETMRGLGLLIREQTKNLQQLDMSWVKCRDEEDLIDLVECCRHVKTMVSIRLWYCGTKEGDRLDSHLKGQQASRGGIKVDVWHDDGHHFGGNISHAVWATHSTRRGTPKRTVNT